LEGTSLIPEKQICDLVDEIQRNGVTLSSEISRILESVHGIEVPPHFIAEYKYRKRHNQEIREYFFDFMKEKPEEAKNP
jgi:hypothetical protein